MQAFQLYLLTEMIRDANIELPPEWNITDDDLQVAKLQIETLGFMKSPTELKEFSGSWYTGGWYREVLGAPIHEQIQETSGLYSLRFRLPLWPSLDFEIGLRENGVLWNKLGFSRAIGRSSPLLEQANDIQKWEFTKEEIEERFGPADETDGWNAYEIASYFIPERPGETKKRYRLWFTYDLLQKIEKDD